MEFREMRRRRQELPREECLEILDRGTSGVLAVAGDGGYPYAVPMSYVRDGDKLLFHCAKSGHKLDAVKREPKASFCVVDQDDVVPSRFTTRYRSVIAFGTVRVADDAAGMRAAAEKLAAKYSPDEGDEARDAEIERDWQRLCVLELEVEHMTGKEGLELTLERGRG